MTTIVAVVVAEKSAMGEIMMYEGLLLYEIEMHVLMMDPNLGKQLMDDKNQFVQTAYEMCHSATIDDILVDERHHVPVVGPGHTDGQHSLAHGHRVASQFQPNGGGSGHGTALCSSAGQCGRVFGMISHEILRPNYIKQYVLNKADKMLSRGFKDQIYDVFRHLIQETQIILLSATIPDEVLDVTSRFMRDPIKKEELTLEGIPQLYISVEKEECKEPCVNFTRP